MSKESHDVKLIELEQARINASRKTEEQWLSELASMDPIEYDRNRERAAKELGIRVSSLDKQILRTNREEEAGSDSEFLADTVPWPDSVEGCELLDNLVASLKRHAVFPAGAAEAIALWCVFTHAHDAARHSPLLALTSPEKRCGKTTVLGLIELLVNRPLQSANITMAATFRAVDKWGPTLLIDEADTFLKSNDELRGVLNSGHKKSSAYVIRTTGDDHEPRQFSTWAPKAIAMIGDLPDTMADRSFGIPLRRRLPSESVDPIEEKDEAEMSALCRKSARWVKDNFSKLKAARPAFPASLHDRARDNWRMALAIADCAGGHWPERARKAAETLSINDDEGSAGVMLLADIHAIFETRISDRIASADLVRHLIDMDERPWSEWRRGQPMTVRSLSKLLAPFSIGPGVIRIDTGTIRGYRKEQFTDAFKRYISPDTPSEASQRNKPSKSAKIEPFRSVTTSANVTDGKAEKPHKSAVCDGVTDEMGVGGEIDEHGRNIEFEERAAILEYDGGLSRKEAEQLAHHDIEKKDLNHD